MSDSLMTPFVFKVRELNRQVLNLPAIARQAKASEAAVVEAHRLLGLAVNGTQESASLRTAAKRAAVPDRMPKRMQDRIQRTRGT